MTTSDPQQSLTSHTIYDQNHQSPQRKEWYSSVASAYHWARPRYPEPMLNRVLKQANLTSSPPSSILEIGCGPGIATTALAERGFHITAVEPSQGACQVMRASCKNYERVTIINSTFEDFNLTVNSHRHPYDAVIAATSFHWLSREIACSKPAKALKAGGALILLWATPPQPKAELYSFLQPIYQKYNLTSLGEEQARTSEYYRQNFEQFAEIVNQSGFFAPSQLEFETHQSTYSIDKYIALLSTLSGYIALAPSTQKAILRDIAVALKHKLGTNELETRHWFATQVAIAI